MPEIKYKYSNYAVWFTMLAAAVICCLFTWHHPAAVNFMGGDSRYYYYYLQSTFISSDLVSYDWLSDPGTPLTHHPVGLALVWLPFFLVALVAAHVFHFPLTGLSLPFQAAISVAALVYCAIGLVYLKKLLQLNNIPDKVTALVLPLIFFGTNLFHYTLNEGGMSHVYSFCLITLFLYHGFQLVNKGGNQHLLYLAALLGLIILIRANNGLVVFTLLFWFKSKAQCLVFFKSLLHNKYLYLSMAVVVAIFLIQPLTWYFKEKVLFINRYAAYGFYWTHPAFFKMLFGFNAGFFIYTPLCFLFLMGLAFVYKPNRFLFFALSAFILFLFYFFSAYSAYTYFDGFGIRVLIDYYALFALLGAKLFSGLAGRPVLYASVMAVALLFALVNLVYCYQVSANILARSGMNYKKWNYIFFKTGSDYENCLGGSNDMLPYAKYTPPASLSATASLSDSFDFSKKDFGPAVVFDSLGFHSNRVCLKINIDRKEAFANASRNVLVCAMLEDKTGKHKSYLQFPLNETPAATCCPEEQYHYTAGMESDFQPDDRISVYLWNTKQQPFQLNAFSAEVYNYNYQQ